MPSVSFHHLGEVNVSIQMDIRKNSQSVVGSQWGGEEWKLIKEVINIKR
jgi:hypothetical protein